MTDSLVVLTDFYAVTTRALSYAAGLAVPLRAHLLLLHVRHDALLAPEEYSENYHTARSDRQTAYALQELAANQPVPTEVDISDEALPAAIHEAVQHRHPLLLVLGRPEPVVTSADLVTETALRLLRKVPYPLLLVPSPGWDAFPPRRLLLVVDGRPFSLRPNQDLLRRLLAATQGTLDVVHVVGENETMPDPEALLGTVRENDLVDTLPDSCLHQVYQNTVYAGVLEEAARLNTDLMIIIVRPHSWVGGLFHASVTARLLRESPIPVLLLPAEV